MRMFDIVQVLEPGGERRILDFLCRRQAVVPSVIMVKLDIPLPVVHATLRELQKRRLVKPQILRGALWVTDELCQPWALNNPRTRRRRNT